MNRKIISLLLLFIIGFSSLIFENKSFGQQTIRLRKVERQNPVYSGPSLYALKRTYWDPHRVMQLHISLYGGGGSRSLDTNLAELTGIVTGGSPITSESYFNIGVDAQMTFASLFYISTGFYWEKYGEKVFADEPGTGFTQAGLSYLMMDVSMGFTANNIAKLGFGFEIPFSATSKISPFTDGSAPDPSGDIYPTQVLTPNSMYIEFSTGIPLGGGMFLSLGVRYRIFLSGLKTDSTNAGNNPDGSDGTGIDDETTSSLEFRGGMMFPVF